MKKLFILLLLLNSILIGCNNTTKNVDKITESNKEQDSSSYSYHHIHPTYKYGYMDSTGNIVIKPTFFIHEDDIGRFNINFHDGYAQFILDNKIGFIDKTGEVVIEAIGYRFFEYNGFYDGLIAVSQ